MGVAGVAGRLAGLATGGSGGRRLSRGASGARERDRGCTTQGGDQNRRHRTATGARPAAAGGGSSGPRYGGSTGGPSEPRETFVVRVLLYMMLDSALVERGCARSKE